MVNKISYENPYWVTKILSIIEDKNESETKKEVLRSGSDNK